MEHLADAFGVSPTTVRRACWEVVVRQNEQSVSVPRTLGIDEFLLRKGQR